MYLQVPFNKLLEILKFYTPSPEILCKHLVSFYIVEHQRQFLPAFFKLTFNLVKIWKCMQYFRFSFFQNEFANLTLFHLVVFRFGKEPTLWILLVHSVGQPFYSSFLIVVLWHFFCFVYSDQVVSNFVQFPNTLINIFTSGNC